MRARYAAPPGSDTWRRSCPRAPRGSRCSPPSRPGRPGLPEEYAEPLLALGLFREEDLHVPVAALSAGQQRRLQIAILATRPADLLVLDEPTNHIALDLIEDLEAALAAYPGAVVAVSHDRGVRERLPGDRLELRDGRRY
jgi:macrolide transport system ATP-binding/permease protein